jgi:hypothetical protein
MEAITREEKLQAKLTEVLHHSLWCWMKRGGGDGDREKERREREIKGT